MRAIRADQAIADVLEGLPPEPSIAAAPGDSLVVIGRGLESLLSWCDTAVDVHREIVRRMNAIRLDDTPVEFQSAYLGHVRAWADKAEAIIRTRTKIRQLVTLARRSARTGAGPVAPESLQRIVDELRATDAADQASTAAIADTWLGVRAVSLVYGVNPDDYTQAGDEPT